MPNDIGLWVSSAKADFQAAAHKDANADFKCAVHHGGCTADLPLVCCSIEDMVRSIALGLNELTEALELMNNRINEIDESVHAQQAAQENQRTAGRSPSLSLT